MGELLAELMVTVQTALATTLLGAVLALSIGALAARNVAPSPAAARGEAAQCSSVPKRAGHR